MAAGVLAVSGAAAVTVGVLAQDDPVPVAAPAPMPTQTPAPAPAPAPSTATPPTPPPSTPAPAPTATATPVVEAQPTDATSLGVDSEIRLQVPSVGIDLPVHALEPEDGAINPPTMSDAYWIDPYGEPGSGDQAPDNTVYIAAHSWSRGDAAFNDLLDDDHVGGAVEPGDEVSVDTASGETTYRVRDVRRYGKDQLPDAEEVWEVVPGRLVLITCFQREDGERSTENLVVTAEAV